MVLLDVGLQGGPRFKPVQTTGEATLIGIEAVWIVEPHIVMFQRRRCLELLVTALTC